MCTNADLVFCWLPSHIGISEEADKAAKKALLKSVDVLPFKFSYGDFKPLINVFIKDVWQRSLCDPLIKNNKLFTVKSTVGEWLPGLRSNRREEIVLARLRIGLDIFNALVPPQRRRSTSMCVLSCTSYCRA